ncbi:MAG: nucleoside monophosphate kinase [bacterium]
MEANTFVIMGRPGSGKGTQAKLLAERFTCAVASLGTEFRHMMASDTVAGLHLTAGLNAGELAPTWLANYLSTKALVALGAGEKIVFDSGCRFLTEAVLFDEITTWLGRDYLVLYVDVAEEEIRRRVAKRGVIEGRLDDSDSALDKRIEEFNTKTLPAINYFRSKGKLLTVDGAQMVEEVYKSILNVIGV